jgi:elongation factor P
MAEVQTLRKGNIYEEDNQLWRVLDYQHIKVARGGATIRLRVRNVRSGATVEKTYNNGARVNDVRLDQSEVQYQYTDGEFYYFMDTETFEQVLLKKEDLEGVIEFLTDNMVVSLETYEGEPISVELPTTVDLKVTWAEVETGYRLQVPMFVTEGDIIRIDTRDGSYVTRVKS